MICLTLVADSVDRGRGRGATAHTAVSPFARTAAAAVPATPATGGMASVTSATPVGYCGSPWDEVYGYRQNRWAVLDILVTPTPQGAEDSAMAIDGGGDSLIAEIEGTPLGKGQ